MKDILGGFMILSVVCAIHSCTADMVKMSGEAQKKSLISYKAYMEMLTK